MYQPPQDPNQQPSFYYDQTQPYPGSFASPPPPPKRNVRAWWRRQSRPVKIGLGCLGIPVILFLLLICSAVSTASPNQSGVPPMITTTTAQHVVQVPTILPTPTQAKPTPTPTALPTPTPTPRLTPLPAPTQQPVPTQPPAPTQAPTTTYNFDPTGGAIRLRSTP
jgi:hypothetical protein